MNHIPKEDLHAMSTAYINVIIILGFFHSIKSITTHDDTDVGDNIEGHIKEDMALIYMIFKMIATMVNL